MAESSLKVGQHVETHDGRPGIVRYVGPLHFAAGEWVGLELLENSGKNDGSVKGERYFTCQLGYGIFVRKESITKIVQSAPSAARSKPNPGTATTAPASAPKPRPSSGITAETARKRQSLMSAGSGRVVTSRLSTRSPTKSPTKTMNSSTSSAISSPRTGTPVTTARTSDASTKSKASIASRTSLAPSNTTARAKTQSTRLSVGGPARTVNAGSTTARSTAVTSRPLVSAPRPSLEPASTVKRQTSGQSDQVTETLKSPTIDEEPQDAGSSEIPTDASATINEAEDRQEESPPSQGKTDPGALSSSRAIRTTSISRNNGAGSVEARTAQQRELEELRARLRTVEGLRKDDQERLQQVTSLQHDRDRFQNIIQALQKKLKANQQEMTELRNTCDEAVSKAQATVEPSAEQETELELANLDREMAEERAENFQMELETLKMKHEELELEVEILREENKELGSVMTPEEKANAGWLQMERERQRLREALVLLRDMSQQSESDLRSEIKELKMNLEEAESSTGLHYETTEKLARIEATNRHLMEQLEAAEANEEMFEAMEAHREQQDRNNERLNKQIQDLEEHIQVTDELEIFHIEEEKRLHIQLDETEASLNEMNRRTTEQDKVIEDLEYTLTKFRDVVQGLQSDIDELRRSRDISEMQANEMSSKSRAMIDLNLRLQNNAAKTQAKIIDTELNLMRADMATRHINVLNLFTLDSFDTERHSVTALLRFGRLQAKASLVGRLLSERQRERAHLSQGEEMFKIFDVIERMNWIAGICQRFDTHMSSCKPEEFSAFGNVSSELEPVERSVTSWLESLRHDELGSDGPEQIQRMQEILIDLADKRIEENTTTKATELVMQMRMVEMYADSCTGQIIALAKLIQIRLGSPKDEDEGSLIFDRKMDQLATKSRTVKYLSGKIVQQLGEYLHSSLCLEDTTWPIFTEAENSAKSLTSYIRRLGVLVLDMLTKTDEPDIITYGSIFEQMTAAMGQIHHANDLSNGIERSDDVFDYFTTRLAALQKIVDDLGNRTSDPTRTIHFEIHPAPWTLRAKELKTQKSISPEIQEELAGFARRNKELSSRIMERDKAIEELHLRVELAEKRMRDSKARDDKDKAEKEEVERLRLEKDEAAQTLEQLRSELTRQLQKSDADNLELEALRRLAAGEAQSTAGSGGVVDEHFATQLKLEMDLARSEIVSLQATVRFLQEENNSLRIPVTETLINAARYNWLDPLALPSGKPTTKHVTTKRQLQRESTAIYSDLIDVASSLKPIRLASRPKSTMAVSNPGNEDKIKPRTWQPTTQTTRYTILKQREEVEKWDAWKTDFVKRARTTNIKPESARTFGTVKRTQNLQSRHKSMVMPRSDGSNLVGASDTSSSKKPEDAAVNGGVVKILQT